MSVAELRAELFKLQKEFVGGRISTLKKHEVAQRLSVMKAAMGMKSGTPVGEPAPPGPLPPREIPTASLSLDESTTVIKPLQPAERLLGKPGSRPAGTAERKTDAAASKVGTKKVAAAKEKKAVRMAPPKVELDESEDHIIHVADVAPRDKKVASKASAAPNTKKPKREPEPAAELKAPVVPAVIRLPGGVRPLDASI